MKTTAVCPPLHTWGNALLSLLVSVLVVHFESVSLVKHIVMIFLKAKFDSLCACCIDVDFCWFVITRQVCSVLHTWMDIIKFYSGAPKCTLQGKLISSIFVIMKSMIIKIENKKPMGSVSLSAIELNNSSNNFIYCFFTSTLQPSVLQL